MIGILKDKGVLLLLLAVLVILACNSAPKQEKHVQKQQYTCSMHPQIIRDAPGACPICGMELVPVHAGTQGNANDSLGAIMRSPDELVLSGIETTSVQRGFRHRQEQVRGIIKYNTNNAGSIASRISGRIEKLYIRYNYQPVVKGQRIMDVYSPDLLNAQQDLLFLKDNSEPELFKAAERKLLLLGVSRKQISSIVRSGKPLYTISVYSPYSGYITDVSSMQPVSGNVSSGTGTIRSASVSGGGMGGGMNGGNDSPVPASSPVPSADAPASVLLKEGQYVSSGERLFNIINPSSVWAEFYITAEQLKLFARNSKINVVSVDNGSKTVTASVTMIQPFYSGGMNYSAVRATIPNPSNSWKTGELINVSTSGKEIEGNWLPRTAVLQLGTRYVVFLQRDGTFKPVYVKVQKRADGWTDVGDSLSSDDKVAVNAWFMVDSESFIKVKQMQ